MKAKEGRVAGLPWCIRHRDGWCATDRKRAPKESEDSSRTVCKHYVILCWGWARRSPTCGECKSRLAAKASCATRAQGRGRG